MNKVLGEVSYIIVKPVSWPTTSRNENQNQSGGRGVISRRVKYRQLDNYYTFNSRQRTHEFRYGRDIPYTVGKLAARPTSSRKEHETQCSSCGVIRREVKYCQLET